MAEPLLFADLKVLDVGSWIAAPVATTMLADYGAQVIKIEAPDLGDGYRNFAEMPGSPDAQTNYTWHMDNRNKRSITLNLKNDAGRKVLRELVEQCDVYVTNLPQPMRRQWQLTYEDLAEVNPSMIYASLTAYGENGPERDREGFDLVAYWSRSGLMDLVRAPGSSPAPALPGMGDHPTAVTLYASIVTALLQRQRTGKGDHVHTSLMANGVWSASCIAQGVFADASFDNYFLNQSRQFTRLLYEANDGRWLQFSMVRTDDEVDAMFIALDRPDALVDERFATSEARLENGEALKALIVEAVAKRSSAEWMRLFAEAGVPAALVGQVADLADDQQVRENNMAIPADGSAMARMIKHPLNIDGLATREHIPAPTQGQHSSEVLQELGYTPEQVAQMREEGSDLTLMDTLAWVYFYTSGWSVVVILGLAALHKLRFFWRIYRSFSRLSVVATSSFRHLVDRAIAGNVGGGGNTVFPRSESLACLGAVLSLWSGHHDQFIARTTAYRLWLRWRRHSISWGLVLRNAVLLAFAWPPPMPGAGLTTATGSLVAITVAFCLLAYVIVNQLFANAAR